MENAEYTQTGLTYSALVDPKTGLYWQFNWPPTFSSRPALTSKYEAKCHLFEYIKKRNSGENGPDAEAVKKSPNTVAMVEMAYALKQTNTEELDPNEFFMAYLDAAIHRLVPRGHINKGAMKVIQEAASKRMLAKYTYLMRSVKCEALRHSIVENDSRWMFIRTDAELTLAALIDSKEAKMAIDLRVICDRLRSCGVTTALEENPPEGSTGALWRPRTQWRGPF
jgi:hypothetical protein